MHAELKINDAGEPVAIWALPYAARLGSSVRGKGIFLHVRLRLPMAARKALTIKAGELTLRLLDDAAAETWIAAATKALDGIEAMPLLPREIEDILTITATERHRWLKDGRLPSAGTRTVKLRGRASKITFHVFDPRLVEDLLDRDAMVEWREDDALTAAENRRRAAWNRRLARSAEPGTSKAEDGYHSAEDVKLIGWEEFERTGLLR